MVVPDYLINAGVIVASLGAAYGGLRAVLNDLKIKVKEIQETANETASRLVKLETRLEAMDSLRYDERLRALEMALARAEGRYTANGEA